MFRGQHPDGHQHPAADRDRAPHHPRLGRRGRRCLRLARRKHVLCTGIAVLDLVFRVRALSAPGCEDAGELLSTPSTAATRANAAVAIAHLGARASFAGPLGGPAGRRHGRRYILWRSPRRRISTARPVRACPGVLTSISAITIDNHGERAIANFRDERLSQTAPPTTPAALVADADAVLADNRYPAYVRDVCSRRARAAYRRCLTPTSRVTTATTCLASHRMSCFRRRVCARPPALTVLAAG